LPKIIRLNNWDRVVMSGHSKWSTIKHKKEAEDKKRGKIFSAIAREIAVAVKEGGSGDPGQNPRLRMLMDKARAANMSKDNVKRAIDRGLGRGGGGSIVEVMYEGYGSGGVGVIVMCETDNKRRTGAEIRNLFEKNDGSLGAPGSTAYLFDIGGGEMKVKVPISVEGKQKEKVERFLELLEQHDDVVKVLSNLS